MAASPSISLAALRLPTGEPKRITMVLDCFHGASDAAMSDAILAVMLEALFQADRIWLQHHPETPDLYDSGVRYVEEPEGAEDWQDISTCLRMGIADCEDLACWLAAELDVRYGVPARPAFEKQVLADGRVLYHIIVRLPDGMPLPDGRTTFSIGGKSFMLDPSRQCGMV
jgi:hypothetical protein